MSIDVVEVVIWRESSVSGGSGAVQMFLRWQRSEERFSRNAETDLVCRLLLEKKKKRRQNHITPNTKLHIATRSTRCAQGQAHLTPVGPIATRMTDIHD